MQALIVGADPEDVEHTVMKFSWEEKWRSGGEAHDAGIPKDWELNWAKAISSGGLNSLRSWLSKDALYDEERSHAVSMSDAAVEVGDNVLGVVMDVYFKKVYFNNGKIKIGVIWIKGWSKACGIRSISSSQNAHDCQKNIGSRTAF